MGACDSGRCCKGSSCTAEKKCCCSAKQGTFFVGQVCRTAACLLGSGCDYRNVCECESAGGTLAQTCNPCDNVACNKCEVCVDGQCVSTCGQCQRCDTSTINGTCVDKCTGVNCGQCKTCDCGNCITTGIACGSTCCSSTQCCVNGACASCDCTGQENPGPCYVCQSGLYVNSCTASQQCCNGVCQQCCNDGHCPSDKKCVSGACEPKQCTDYKEVRIFVCIKSTPEGQFCANILNPPLVCGGECGGGWQYVSTCPSGCYAEGSAGDCLSGNGYPAGTSGKTCERPCKQNAFP